MKVEDSKPVAPPERKQVAEPKKRDTDLEAQNQAREQEAKPEEKPALATA